MALMIDSRSVLRAMAEHPDAFPAIQADVDAFIRKALIKQLKAKSTDASLFKKIYRITGETNMSSLLDAYAAKEVLALIKKIDPFSAYSKSAAADLQSARSHIADIATDRVHPASKPEKPSRQPKSTAKPIPPKIGGVLESKVHSGKPRSSRTRVS